MSRVGARRERERAVPRATGVPRLAKPARHARYARVAPRSVGVCRRIGSRPSRRRKREEPALAAAAGDVAPELWALQPPEPGREPEPPGDPERLETDAARHLRLPHHPIHEDDRYLVDGEPAPPGTIGGLDLERIAVGADTLEADRGERAAPPTLEPARGIAHRQTRHSAHVPVAEVADEEALD